jgi:hypothetical protein
MNDLRDFRQNDAKIEMLTVSTNIIPKPTYHIIKSIWDINTLASSKKRKLALFLEK